MKLPPGHVPGEGVLKPSGYGGFGERMLQSMGWSKGQGLGRNENGIKEAIQVKKKEDTVGIGAKPTWEWDKKYWEVAYESVQLGTEDGSDSSDSDSSDDEATGKGAAGFGAPSVNRDGTFSSASAQELRLLKALSKGPATGRFGGREAKMARIREQEAKLAAEYAARLGVSTTTTVATTATTTAALAAGSDRSDTTSEVVGRPSSSSKHPGGKKAGGEAAAEGGKEKKKRKRKGEAAGEPHEEQQQQEESSGGEKKKKKKIKKLKGEAAEAAAAAEEGLQGAAQQQQQQPAAQEPEPPRQRVVIEPAIECSGPMAEFKPTPATGWWGEKRFVSAGSLEGAKKDVQGAKERMTFNEDDQERVYMAAHANKVARGTKKGLGQSQAVGKVGGVKWAGSKVTFQDEDEEDGAGGEAKARPSQLAAIGSSTHLDSLAAGASDEETKAQGASGSEQQGADVTGSDWTEGIKWKKLITKALEAAGGSLKLKELQAQVAAAAAEKLGAQQPGKKALRAEVAARAAGSSKFVVDGKRVRLRS